MKWKKEGRDGRREGGREISRKGRKKGYFRKEGVLSICLVDVLDLVQGPHVLSG
jgi:hypothetical protein